MGDKGKKKAKIMDTVSYRLKVFLPSDCLKVCDDIVIFKTLPVETVVETGNRHGVTKKKRNLK